MILPNPLPIRFMPSGRGEHGWAMFAVGRYRSTKPSADRPKRRARRPNIDRLAAKAKRLGVDMTIEPGGAVTLHTGSVATVTTAASDPEAELKKWIASRAH